MWKMFTANNNRVYYDKLDDLVNQYNNTKHSSIKMTPMEASNKKNQGTVYFNLYGNLKQVATKPKYQIITSEFRNTKENHLIRAIPLTGLKKYLL